MTDIELMRQLAERVMGWGVVERPINRRLCYDFSGPHVFLEIDGTFWRGVKADGNCTISWRPLESLDDALLIMRHFEAAGCAAWVECDGHTGRRGGVTTQNGRFEAEAETEARALCLAALEVARKK